MSLLALPRELHLDLLKYFGNRDLKAIRQVCKCILPLATERLFWRVYLPDCVDYDSRITLSDESASAIRSIYIATEGARTAKHWPIIESIVSRAKRLRYVRCYLDCNVRRREDSMRKMFKLLADYLGDLAGQNKDLFLDMRVSHARRCLAVLNDLCNLSAFSYRGDHKHTQDEQLYITQRIARVIRRSPRLRHLSLDFRRPFQPEDHFIRFDDVLQELNKSLVAFKNPKGLVLNLTRLKLYECITPSSFKSMPYLRNLMPAASVRDFSNEYYLSRFWDYTAPKGVEEVTFYHLSPPFAEWVLPAKETLTSLKLVVTLHSRLQAQRLEIRPGNFFEVVFPVLRLKVLHIIPRTHYHDEWMFDGVNRFSKVLPTHKTLEELVVPPHMIISNKTLGFDDVHITATLSILLTELPNLRFLDLENHEVLGFKNSDDLEHLKTEQTFEGKLEAWRHKAQDISEDKLLSLRKKLYWSDYGVTVLFSQFEEAFKGSYYKLAYDEQEKEFYCMKTEKPLGNSWLGKAMLAITRQGRETDGGWEELSTYELEKQIPEG